MLVYLSKFCKSIVVHFSWDDWKLEKSETNYKFWGLKGVLWAMCEWWINGIKSILIKSNLHARVLKSIRQLCKRMVSSIDTKIVFHFPGVRWLVHAHYSNHMYWRDQWTLYSGLTCKMKIIVKSHKPNNTTGFLYSNEISIFLPI